MWCPVFASSSGTALLWHLRATPASGGRSCSSLYHWKRWLQQQQRGRDLPLDFLSPRFAACRKIKSSSKIAGFTLVSNATQRAWEAVKPLRECQFGQVFLAVEVIHTSSGRGWGRASSSPKYFAIKVRELVLDYEKKTAMKQHAHPRILQQQRS